jgi:hypothetical protein
MTDSEFVVYAIDVGCDCCSYIAAATFGSKADAERWVAETRDPSNYHIEEM